MENAQLLSILDGINEAIYISDPLTHEMLYANSSIINTFGSYEGKKCFHYLQSMDSPCSFCSNDKIFGKNAQSSYTWEFKNSINKRWYHCIDSAIEWPDGRMVRCEIAVDIDDMKRNEKELDSYRTQLNELVIERTKRIRKLAELSMQLIGEPEVIFGNIIKSLGQMLSVKLVCLSEVYDEKAHCLYLYDNGELISDIDSCEINGVSYEFLNNIKDIEIYEDAQAIFPESEFLARRDASSYCVLPCMNSKGEIVAVLNIIDDNSRKYSEEDRDIIRIIGQRIGKEIERVRIEKIYRGNSSR
jgi:hypothetical protein